VGEEVRHIYYWIKLNVGHSLYRLLVKGINIARC